MDPDNGVFHNNITILGLQSILNIPVSIHVI